MIDFLMFDPPLRAIISSFPAAHALSDVAGAVRAGADYVTLSPIFVTVSKPAMALRWR